MSTKYDDFFTPAEESSEDGDIFFEPIQEKPKPKKRNIIEKTGRLGMQYALGAMEQAALPYELAVAPLASKEAQHANYRENLFSDIEMLQEQKQSGDWS